MTTSRCLVLVCSLAVLTAGAGFGQEPKRKRPAEGRPAGQLERPLMPAELAEKLNLTAEAKVKIGVLEKEYASKVKGADTKFRAAMEKARQDQDRAAYRKAQEDLQAALETRRDYEGKVVDLLNPEQRKTFAQAAGERSRPGAPAASPLLSPAVLERLELSPEQKSKIADLQKEFEQNLLKVLNEEQRQRLEQFKSRCPRRQQESGSRDFLPPQIVARRSVSPALTAERR